MPRHQGIECKRLTRPSELSRNHPKVVKCCWIFRLFQQNRLSRGGEEGGITLTRGHLSVSWWVFLRPASDARCLANAGRSLLVN